MPKLKKKLTGNFTIINITLSLKYSLSNSWFRKNTAQRLYLCGIFSYHIIFRFPSRMRPQEVSCPSCLFRP